MPTLLRLISPFPSTGKYVPETNQTKSNACGLSGFKKDPSLSLRKNLRAAFPTKQSKISPEIIASTLHNLKNESELPLKELLDAYELFVEMADKGNRLVPSLGETLVYNLWSRDMFRKAVRVAELMVQNGTLLSESVCTFIIGNLRKIGAHEYAIQLLDEMQRRSCTLNSILYDDLIISLCRQEPSCRVWHCLDKIIQTGHTPNNLYVLSRFLKAAHLCGGSSEWAVSVLYQFLLRGVEPNMECYNHILTAFQKENRVTDALELFSTLPTNMKNLRTYSILFSAVGVQGRWRDAEALLDSMMERGIWPSIFTYKEFIRAIANNGYAEEALEIAEELGRYGFKTDEWCFSPTIMQFCSECRLDMVHKCLESMERWNCPFNSGTYRAITLLCNKGMLDEAVDILEYLRRKQGEALQSFYGNEVFPYMCKKGNPCEALQILSKILHLGYTPNSQTISCFVKALCGVGLHEEALEMFEARDKYDILPGGGNYKTLVVQLCKGGRIDLGIIALEKMVIKGYVPTEGIYVEIIGEIGNLGRKDLVGELLMELYAREQLSRKNMELISLKLRLDMLEFSLVDFLCELYTRSDYELLFILFHFLILREDMDGEI